jgi:hypothetical protein
MNIKQKNRKKKLTLSNKEPRNYYFPLFLHLQKNNGTTYTSKKKKRKKLKKNIFKNEKRKKLKKKTNKKKLLEVGLVVEEEFAKRSSTLAPRKNVGWGISI